jgi:hypothetical protein
LKVNKKRGKEEDEGPRLNNAITAPLVRLVTDEGHNVVPLHEALQLASRMDMDLVEVNCLPCMFLLDSCMVVPSFCLLITCSFFSPTPSPCIGVI